MRESGWSIAGINQYQSGRPNMIFTGTYPYSPYIGENNFLTRPNVVPGVSVADLADRLKRLLTDPCAAKAMGEKGLAWVHQEWRWEIITQRFAEILAGE